MFVFVAHRCYVETVSSMIVLIGVTISLISSTLKSQFKSISKAGFRVGSYQFVLALNTLVNSRAIAKSV